jgi:transposase-like protein
MIELDRADKNTDDEVAALSRHNALPQRSQAYLWLDARYEKVRIGDCHS